LQLPSPYLRAFHAWHSQGAPSIPWNDLLTWFLHHGALISTPDAFLLARRLPASAPASHHLLLPSSPLHSPADCDCWNIWLAAGNLRHLLTCATLDPLPYVSYCRRGSDQLRIRRLDELTQSAAAATLATAAGLRHRPRESRSRS